MTLLLYIIILVLVIANVLIFLLLKKPATDDAITEKIIKLQAELSQFQRNFRDDLSIGRQESRHVATESRKELNDSLETFRNELRATLNSILERNDTHLKTINDTLSAEMRKLNEDIEKKNETHKNALLEAITRFNESFDKNVKSFNELQREKFGQMEENQRQLVKNTEEKLEKIRVTVEEKLEKTLADRLGQSFETVGKQLTEVQQGLGEMKALANDVGGLKKVLSNVKMRGGIGEVQLAMLLEQMLSTNQFQANAKVNPHSDAIVEFAILLPGKDDDDGNVSLPIDAKFPAEIYDKLNEAYDHGTQEEITTATKLLENTIIKMAKDIHDKYIHPPYTTDFAMMFLPFEGIYAEVIRNSSLIDKLQREYKVTVAGPTTLMAILNALQMGFRTLAIQKRSSEVWKVLGMVKNEFDKFGGLLEKAQKNFQTGMNNLDQLVGTRTNQIRRTLRNVENYQANQHLNLVETVANDLLENNFSELEELEEN